MLCSLSVSLVYIKAWSTGVSGSCDWHWTWTWTIVSINKTFSSNSIIFLMDNWGLPNHGRNWWWWICFLSTLSFNINCNKKFAQKQDLWGLFLHTSGVILPYSMKSEKSPIWRNSWKGINSHWLKKPDMGQKVKPKIYRVSQKKCPFSQSLSFRSWKGCF